MVMLGKAQLAPVETALLPAIALIRLSSDVIDALLHCPDEAFDSSWGPAYCVGAALKHCGELLGRAAMQYPLIFHLRQCRLAQRLIHPLRRIRHLHRHRSRQQRYSAAVQTPPILMTSNHVTYQRW